MQSQCATIETENHIEYSPTPPNSPIESRLERMRKILQAELKEKEYRQKQRWIEISTRNKQFQPQNEFMRIRKNQNSKKSQMKRKYKRLLKPIEEQRMGRQATKKYYHKFLNNYFFKINQEQINELETLDRFQRTMKKICIGCCEPIYFGKKHDCPEDYPVYFLLNYPDDDLPGWLHLVNRE